MHFYANKYKGKIKLNHCCKRVLSTAGVLQIDSGSQNKKSVSICSLEIIRVLNQLTN